MMSQNFSDNGSGVNNYGGGVGCYGGGPCGACKFLKRKCWPQCIYAPYFDSDQGIAQFTMVHKVFGASNVSKLLQIIPLYKRRDAVNTLIYEAQARLIDPVYGCIGEINTLRQQVVSLQEKVSGLQGQLATLELAQQLPPPPPQTTVAPPAFSIGDFQYPSTMASSTTPTPTTYDLSSIVDHLAQTSWAMEQRAMDSHQHSASGTSILPYSNASSFLSFSK